MEKSLCLLSVRFFVEGCVWVALIQRSTQYTTEAVSNAEVSAGNPHGRRVAQLRAAMIAAITDEDMTAIVQTLVKKAKDGEIPAIKILLDYNVGRPIPAVDVDELNRKISRRTKASAAMTVLAP